MRTIPAPNRLAGEKSPYLLMHSENPVAWYPWGEEAFAAAKAQDKPVFLSIGYSSCHWCHVIAHESFEDESVAALLNQDYIAVKVDKEERPDIDAVYMDAVQLSTGSGGWPMTLLLTTEGAPFFAATYLPRETLKDLLKQAAALWKKDRPALLRDAETLTDQMRRIAVPAPRERAPDAALTDRALRAYAARYDRRFGGFGPAPKFPAAHSLLFLLSHYEKTGAAQALAMAEGTLTGMYRGGLFDHIGGGFCRYSVDEKWLTPHFEKMLYDNALLLWAYAEAWRMKKNPLYRRAAESTADYVLREMTGPEGEFFCAQDADSLGKEGAYYVFSREELIFLLGAREGTLFCDWYGIVPGGNFEGKSIPNLLDHANYADPPDDLSALLARVAFYRKNRMPLGRDDKVLSAWNGLMIAGLCRAGVLLNRQDYLEAARRAERFLRAHLMDGRGGLMLRYRDGEAKGEGVLADYANVALALLELFDATAENAYLEAAKNLAGRMLLNFSEKGKSGLYLYSDQGEQLLTRPMEVWDSAMPSGNAVAALVFWKLSQHTNEEAWRHAADAQLRFLSGLAEENPLAHGFGLLTISKAL